MVVRGKDNFQRVFVQRRFNSVMGKRLKLVLAFLFTAVIAVIGLVAFTFERTGGNNRWTGAQSDMGQIRQALLIYRLQHERFPDRLEVLTERAFPNGVPLDPFTKEHYLYITNGESFVLICYGKDDAPGGTDDPELDIVYSEQGLLATGR